ncbi:glycosyltransferase [Candidatus Falkowbacteria bacterium]|nr:glycosyltransferase [Candidatus Falkowbacteria bacterium]
MQKEKMKEDITISVCMVTYNHAKYIAQAIEGVLAQEAGFGVHLFVGDDASTDSTREIVKAYVDKFPDKITMLTTEKNMGGHLNYLRTLAACKGRYVAVCEGDDFWTDKRKLAKQVAFLDENDDCAICCHPVAIYRETDHDQSQTFPDWPIKPKSDTVDLLSKNFIGACSTVFRNDSRVSYPDWLLDMKITDWPMNVLRSEFGLIGYLPEKMSSYRVHAGGTHSARTKIYQFKSIIEAYRRMGIYFGKKHRGVIMGGMVRTYYFIFKELIKHLLRIKV